jgi:hypothetical protein
MLPATWQLDGSCACLRMPRFSAHVSLRESNVGLDHLTCPDSNLLDQHVLSVSVPSIASEPDALVDSYVRGGDLVATYRQTASWPFRVQFYWRAGSHSAQDAYAAIELVASLQTDLLDSRPELVVSSRLQATEIFQWFPSEQTFHTVSLASGSASSAAPCNLPGCVLLRLADCELSYVEMVHPLDFGSSQLVLGGRTGLQNSARGADVRIEHTLCTHWLEKGVILRARVLGVFLPRHNDQMAAIDHYRSFANEDLPLTT